MVMKKSVALNVATKAKLPPKPAPSGDRDQNSFTSTQEMAQYYSDHPDEWARVNNNAQKSASEGIQAPVAPQGGSTPVAAPVPSPVPAPSAAVSGISRETTASTDPFGDYLKNNGDAQDAWAYLEALLNDYGIGQVSSFVKDNIIQGRSQNEIVQRLRETDTYKTRFSAIEQRKKDGLPPISEAEVVSYERQATQMMRSAGLPQGFWDQPEDFTNLLVKDVSVAELNARINDGYVAAMQAPPEERKALEELYGVTAGSLAAYYIDPDRTEAVLKQQYAAAQASAEGVRSGYGALSRQEAERMAALGIDSGAARQGFGDILQKKELYSALPGTGTDEITREQQLAATFANDATQQKRIKRTGEERVATFQGGGQFAADKTGTSGLGTAR